jgi:hypothetical protein
MSLLALPASGWATGEPEEGGDGPAAGFEAPCRQAETADADGRLQGEWFPGSAPFRPLIADAKEPRFVAGLGRTWFRPGELAGQNPTGNINAAYVGFGDSFGIRGWRDARCNGLQVGIFGAVFSQFDLSSPAENLINSDFQVGIPLTWRAGRWSGRLRAYHQSSHLGDDFLLFNNHVRREVLSFEAIDALVAYSGRWWRLYGGPGVLIHSVNDLAPLYAQAGAEMRAHFWRFGSDGSGAFVPLAGADVFVLQERNWGPTITAKAGIEWHANDRSNRRLRMMLVFLEGFFPYSQYFDTDRMTNLGLELQFQL